MQDTMPFYAAMLQRQYGGAGLGLAIASRVVGMMGGVIGVESSPGNGSVFHFAVKFKTSVRK
jgi:signal transduction histidine kinase